MSFENVHLVFCRDGSILTDNQTMKSFCW